jgi:hypothetical protein
VAARLAPPHRILFRVIDAALKNLLTVEAAACRSVTQQTLLQSAFYRAHPWECRRLSCALPILPN